MKCAIILAATCCVLRYMDAKNENALLSDHMLIHFNHPLRLNLSQGGCEGVVETPHYLTTSDLVSLFTEELIIVSRGLILYC